MSASPSTDNYSLGKGVVYFDRFDTDGNLTGELDLGNAPAFNISTAVETLDHFESRSGIKEKDLQVETSIGASVAFTLDEYSKENIALALRASEPTTESQGSGTVAAETTTMRVGKWVKLTYRNVNTVVIAGSVEGTDFEVDKAVGRIRAIAGGNISDGASKDVSYNYTSETWNVINAISNSGAIEGFIRFVGDPEQGPAYEVQIWKAKIRLSGNISLISDDWGTLEFEGEIQKDVAGHPTSPWFKVLEEGTAGGGS